MPRDASALNQARLSSIDCLTGGILALTSMPAFDPNAFADGIGRLEWKMLNEDDHVPLLNKALRGLYPPGSTMKPMAASLSRMAGSRPMSGFRCRGRLCALAAAFSAADPARPRVGRHAQPHRAQLQHLFLDHVAPRRLRMPSHWSPSCSAWGRNSISRAADNAMARFPMPPGKCADTSRSGARFDSLNASIGQGYVSVSPAAACGNDCAYCLGTNLQPLLIHGPGSRGPGAAVHA